MTDDIVNLASQVIAKNQDCYVAHWILNNPDKNMKDYTLCYQQCFTEEGYTKFWMELK